MRRIFTALLFAGLLGAQTAKYPTAVATDADLKVAKNRVQTTLRGSITASDTTVVVASATGIVANQLLCIESEVVSVTSLIGASLTVVRGFDATVPAAHSTGRPVGNCVAAWYWTALSAEVKAIEATLGANMINVPGGGDVNGPAPGAGGEVSILDVTGHVLTRSNLTGVLKITAGVPSVVTGAGTNCVLVDGTSGTCGGGAGTVTSSGTPVIYALPIWTTSTDLKGLAVPAAGTILQGNAAADPAFTNNPFLTAIAAPGTPAAGLGSVYVDSTSKNLAVKDDAGVVKHGVQTQAGAANEFLTSISDAGVVAKAQPTPANLGAGTLATVMTVGAAGSVAPTSPTVGAVSANQINGVSMAGLVTGMLKITTTTGAPSIATATDLSGPQFCVDAGSTDSYACTLSPAIAAYVTGSHYRVKANTANTGAASLALNGLAVIPIKKVAGGITTDLATNDIRAGQWFDVVYDGTNMQMQSLLGNAPAMTADAVTGAATLATPGRMTAVSGAGAITELAGITATGGVITATGFSGPLTGNAATATALAVNPTACTSGKFAIDMDADGTFICDTPPAVGVGATVNLTDFTPSIAGHTLTVQPGRARIGNSAPAEIAIGTVHFNDASGSGDVRVFIDQNMNLVCHAQTGVTYSVTGTMTCSNVATPAYPANSIPIADLNVVTGSPPAVTIDADDRAFFSTKAVTAGTGVSITDTGGVASIAVDLATIPLLGANNAWTGANDFTAATNFYIRRGAGVPAAAECDAAGEVGQLYARSNAAAASASLYVCANNGAGTYAWELGGGGGGLADPGGNGFLDRTALNTTAARTLTGTANEIAVTNGGGGGNPVFSLSSTFDISGKTSTKPMKSGTTAPVTCAVGEMFFDTDAAAGNNLYACTATDTWTVQAGTGAPAAAQYLALALDAGLSAERVLTPRDGLAGTDAGAGSTYTIDRVPDSTSLFIEEDFSNSNAENKYLGLHGWRAMTSGTGASLDGGVQGTDNHPGQVRLASGTGNSGYTQIYLGPAYNYTLLTADTIRHGEWEMSWIFKLTSATVTDATFRVGLFPQLAYVYDAVYLSAEAGGTYWQFNWCGDACTQTSSGVAIDTNWHRVKIFRLSGDTQETVRFCLDACGSNTQMTETANAPRYSTNPGMYFANTAGGTTSNSVTVDWMGLKVRGLSRW